jgi:hypothetical protein
MPAKRNLPRRRRKRTTDGKRLDGKDPFPLALNAAMEFLSTALATQRAKLACSPTTNSVGEPIGVDELVNSDFDGVRTVEQLRAALTAAELAELAASLECALNEMARAIINGVGNRAHAQRRHQEYCALEGSFSELVRLPAPLEDLVKAARMGKATPDRRELAYPSKTRLRTAIARELGVDERTVRRLERDTGETGLDSRALKTRADLAAEKRLPMREK